MFENRKWMAVGEELWSFRVETECPFWWTKNQTLKEFCIIKESPFIKEVREKKKHRKSSIEFFRKWSCYVFITIWIVRFEPHLCNAHKSKHSTRNQDCAEEQVQNIQFLVSIFAGDVVRGWWVQILSTTNGSWIIFVDLLGSSNCWYSYFCPQNVPPHVFKSWK